MKTRIEITHDTAIEFNEILSILEKLNQLFDEIERENNSRLKSIKELATQKQLDTISANFNLITTKLETIKTNNQDFWKKSKAVRKYEQNSVSTINNIISYIIQLKELQDFLPLIRNIYDDYLDYLKNYESIIKWPDISQLNTFIVDEIIIIQNLIALNEYRTALLVVGRTIEQMYRKIGEKRKITKVKILSPSSTIKWKKLNFNGMNKALNKTKKSNKGSILINKRIMSEVSPIIQYRNLGAHPISESELKDIEDNAISHIQIGLNTIKKLNEIYNEIPANPSRLLTPPEIDSLR